MSSDPLEKSVQASVVSYARKLGIRCDKLSSGSRFQSNGLPDYIFWIGGGHPLLIEFKRSGGQPTPLQSQVHAQLKGLGYVVHVIDNSAAGKRLLDSAQVSASRSEVPSGPRSGSALP